MPHCWKSHVVAQNFLHRKINVWLKVSFQASFQPMFHLTTFGDEFCNKTPINLLLNNQYYQALQANITSHLTSQDKQESKPLFTAMCPEHSYIKHATTTSSNHL